MSNTKKVLFIDSVHDVLQHDLQAVGFECIFNDHGSPSELSRIYPEAEGIVLRSRWIMNAATIQLFPHLKWIARSGSGLENIDVQYSTKNGIKIFSSPEGNADAVGEHVLAMLLSMTRKIITANQSVKNHQWLRELHRGAEIQNMTIAIIGLGHMGRSVARKLKGLGCRIIAYDKYLPQSPLEYVSLVDLNTVFEEANVISLHLPLSEETRYFADALFFQSFKKPFYFINTSRGQHCSTRDLISGLNNNKIIGAALDVLEFESAQLQVENENSEYYYQLIQHPKVILTPHIAGWTVESYYKLSKVLSEKILAYYSLGF